ncbi:MAG: hypothetical protein BGO34_01110 [Bacteroidia bacterium 44-10]|nr:MAG: hypothetical protein BGO34_01110 [Bacteroidia bacterium 44-10]
MNVTRVFLFTVVLFTTTIHIFPQTAEEWKKLGNVELDSANLNKAIEYYQKAIEVDSNYFDAYFNLGIAFTHLPDFEKAIKYFSKAVTKNDTVAGTYFMLGNIYAQKLDFDNAIKVLKQGLLIKPDSPQETYYLGSIYNEKGNYFYANLYAKKAAQLGDSIAQQMFIDNNLSWEDSFEKPNYDQIQANIGNKQSNFYYQKLWDRYLRGDSTLTVDEARHIYYGYVFNKDYSSLSSAKNTKEVYAILNKEEPSQKEWEEVISLLNTALQVEPFSCRYLYYQNIAYNALKNDKDAAKNHHKIQCVLNALTSTGDAFTKETAIHVIAVPTEYDYLFLLNLPRGDQALVNGGFDVLYIGENQEGIEEMWFDVNQSLNNMFKK